MASNPQKITSINSVTKKARVLFSALILLSLSFFTATYTVGAKTGELQEKLINPLKMQVSAMLELSKEKENNNIPNGAYVKNESTVEINSNTDVNSASQQRYNYSFPKYPKRDNSSYESAKAQNDEWWEKAQGQVDLDSWRQEMEEKQQQFLIDNGINP